MAISATPPSAAALGLSPAQYQHAQEIIAQGKAMGFGLRDIEIAEMTAVTESGLQNYANANNPESLAIPHDAVGSDHGSVGLFQQQVGGAPNSTANWGTTRELMTPVIAARKFYEKLVTITGRASMNPWNVGQAVQGSAFDDGSNYQAAWDRGKQIADALYTGTIANPGGAPGSPAYADTVGGLTPGKILLGPGGSWGAKKLGEAFHSVSGDVGKALVLGTFILGGAGLVIVGARRAVDTKGT